MLCAVVRIASLYFGIMADRPQLRIHDSGHISTRRTDRIAGPNATVLLTVDEAISVCKETFVQVRRKDALPATLQCDAANEYYDFFIDLHKEHRYTAWISARISFAENLESIKPAITEANRKRRLVRHRCYPQISFRSPQECGSYLQECILAVVFARRPCYLVNKRMLEYKNDVEGGADGAIFALKITKTASFVVAGTIATALSGGAAAGALTAHTALPATAVVMISSGAGAALGAGAFTFVEMTASQYGNVMAGLQDDMDWKSIRSASLQQAAVGFVTGGVAKPLANWAGPKVGSLVMQKLATAAPGLTEGAKTVLGAGLSKMLADASQRAVSGAVWNAIVTGTQEALTSSARCQDACRAVVINNNGRTKFRHACEMIGKRRKADGAVVEDSDGACEVNEDISACRQKVQDACKSDTDSAACEEKAGCSVGSEGGFLCRLAVSMIQGAAAGVIFNNDYTLGHGGKYIGQSDIKDVQALRGLLSVEGVTAAANSCT